MNSELAPIQIAIVAKFPFYAQDISDSLLGLPQFKVLPLSSIEELNAEIEHLDPKFPIFFPHFSETISESLLSKFVCIGFHTGNLPKDRGGSPIQNKILRGEYSTFVSALRLTENLDAGPIFLQSEIDLSYGNIEEVLRRISIKIAQITRRILVENPPSVEQQGEPSVFNRLKKSDNELDFASETLREMYDKIRMVDGLDYEPAYFEHKGKTVKVRKATLEKNQLFFSCQIESE